MQLGTIQGEVDTSSFTFRATEEVRKFDFVSVKSNDKWILAQVEEVTKHPDGETEAEANIIGYRDKGLTKAPRRVIEPDSIVYSADQELISDTLGLENAGLNIGHLETNDDIDIFVDGDEFYKHFAVLAQTGAGKCVTPDTSVLMSDGGLKPIEEIFESSDEVIKKEEGKELRVLSDCSVKSVDGSYGTTDADALYAYREKASKVLKVRTASGREIEVTPEHPLMVAEEGYEFVNSEEIEAGQHIAAPREIESRPCEDIELSDGLKVLADRESERRNEQRRKYRRYRQLSEKGLSVAEIAEEVDVPRGTVENWRYRGYQPAGDGGLALSMNAKGVDVPESFSPDLAEFLGLVIAEGAEQRAEGSYRIVFTNDEDRLLQRFRNLASELFGLETRSMRENASYLDSTSLKHLLEDIGYDTLRSSRDKTVPRCVMRSSEESKRRFLRTFFDCEGCMEDHEVTLSSASEDVINSLSYMLLDFGIVSRISSSEKEATNSGHEGDTYYRLSISGVSQMERFVQEIGFGIGRKRDRLEEYLQEKEGNTNTDVVPVDGEYLKKERKKLDLSQRELAEKIGSHSTLVSLYERDERRPSRENFARLAEHLDSKLYSQLADSDVYWDRVVSVEEKEHDGYVYDITVRDHHNFIAGRGGIVSHNSYLTGVLSEELLEEEFPLIIVDPHGEYSSLQRPNPEIDDGKGYEVEEYSPNTDINSSAQPLSFSSVNLEKKELMDVIPDSLTNSQMGVLYNSLKRLREKDEDYDLKDIMDAVSEEDSTAKWNLLNSLEQVERSGLFSDDPVDLEELVEPGRATVINLKAVEPEEAEITMYMLAQKLFDLRKRDRVPPFLMVIEEAHNFAPEKGFSQAQSNEILRKIASEGRKFGLGLGVISQRPARIDKNVLSQCNTQFILRVTNPNDLNAISKSFEGVTSEVEDMIKSLPPGVAFVLGKDYPVMTDVRTRKSEHGGETETGAGYEEHVEVRVYPAHTGVEELESETGDRYSAAYYPLYLLENDGKRMLVDGTSGEVKSERDKLSGDEKEVFELAAEGRSKGEIVEELDLGVTKVSSILDKLEQKGRLSDGEVTDSVLDLEPVEESVGESDLIDFEFGEEEARSMLKSCSLERLYYPYYSNDDRVYDPVLETEVG